MFGDLDVDEVVLFIMMIIELEFWVEVGGLGSVEVFGSGVVVF